MTNGGSQEDSKSGITIQIEEQFTPFYGQKKLSKIRIFYINRVFSQFWTVLGQKGVKYYSI